MALCVLLSSACTVLRPAGTETPAVQLPLVPRLEVGSGAVIGVVVDSAFGSPIVGARVGVARYTTSDANPELTSALASPSDTTDGRGGFVLNPLSPGRWSIIVGHVLYETERRVVDVNEGVLDTVQVTLRPLRTIRPPNGGVQSGRGR